MRKTISQRLLGIAFVVAIFPLVASAQEGLRDRDRTFTASRKIAEDMRSARLRYGPFYFLSRLELSDIGYTDQFYLPTDDQASGLTASVIAPQRLYFVPSRKTIFSAEVTPQYYFLEKNRGSSSRDHVGFFTRADAQIFLNHFYFDVYGTRSQELRGNVDINRLATRADKSIGTTGEFRYSSRTSATWAASYRQSRYPTSRLQPEDIDVHLLDRTEHNVRIGARHKTFPLTSLLVAAEVSNYAFPFTTYKDSRRTYAGAGFDFDNGRSGLRAEAGMASLTWKRQGPKEFHGAVGNAQFTRKLNDRMTLSLGGTRDVDFSIYVNNYYFVADRAAFSTDYSATRRLTLRFASTYGRDSYDIPTLVNGFSVRRRDNVSFTSVGWIYSLRRLRGGFDVGWYQRNSNVEVDDNNGIRLVLHLSLAP